MRKLLRIAVATPVAYTIWLGLTMFWSFLIPAEVTLCTLACDPEVYHLSFVRITGSATVISSQLSEPMILIYEPGCPEPDAAAVVILDESYKLTPEVDEFINAPKEEYRNADVVIEGRFDQAATMGCFTPRFGITASSIRLLSPISSEPLPRPKQKKLVISE
jgi:hypothetical protein